MNVLLIGGSKSGKSMHAQRLCRALAQGGAMYYWAAMEPTAGEDRARIARHRLARAGWGFVTIEQGRDLPAAFCQLPPQATVLFDSLTAHLSNEMFSSEPFSREAHKLVLPQLFALSAQCRHLVCVCDDVFRDGTVYDDWTECYRRNLALCCRALAAQFDAVLEVSAGIARAWKGDLHAQLD